ncbi:MAG: DUF927 domain-containing protein [Desulfuromonadales bacterium]
MSSLSVVRNLTSTLKQVPAGEVHRDPGIDIDLSTDLDKEVAELASLNFEEYGKVRTERAKALKLRVKELDGLVAEARRSIRSPRKLGPDGCLAAYEMTEEGLIYTDPNEESPVWISQNFDILGMSSTESGSDQALVLSFSDAKGRVHRIPVRRSELAGDAGSVLKQLLGEGFSYCPDRAETNHLKKYLVYMQPEKSLLVRSKAGWYKSCFVLPTGVVGPLNGEEIIFHSTAKIEGWSERGTLEEWQQKVSALCRGNSRLLFSVSMAFAAPLLLFAEGDGGGFNMVGNSSCGKTTAMKVGNSVWGSPERLSSWRVTSNGLEASAELHNHALHCLDEMGLVKPKEIGEIAYMLGLGQGKGRAKKDGSARDIRSWCSLQLSTGELSLGDHMEAGQQQVRTGQELRMIDIEADAGREMGVVEELHGQSSSRTFIDTLNRNVCEYYGTAIRVYLEKLTGGDLEALKKRFFAERDNFIAFHVPAWSSGQVSRAASRIFLVGFGGELATELGITGWQAGEAMQAAVRLLNEWVTRRGGYGFEEASQILRQVRGFFERYGSSRFIDLDAESDFTTATPHERWGYVTSMAYGNDTTHYVLPEVFKNTLLRGRNLKTAIKVLAEAGILVPGKNNASQSKRLAGQQIRVYVIKDVLSFDAGETEEDQGLKRPGIEENRELDLGDGERVSL